MVGISGAFGEAAGSCDVETVPPTIDGGEVTDRYRERGVTISSAFHAGMATDQPVEAADGGLVWVWGEVYSVTDGAGARTTVDPAESARVCARQYSEHGLEFISRLDGEFVGCIYDADAGTVSFFLDRLGARPLYYWSGEDGFAFSTSVQTVPLVPEFEPRFDERYLAEYLYCRRTLGTKTPVEGIEQLPPATVLTYDLESKTTEQHRYWEPRYRPVDEPLSYFTRELADRFERAVADRTSDDREHGVLLSGGSDSRAVLAAADEPPTAFHLGDGWNREARIAKRAADAAGAAFRLLNRGPDYHATLLERAAPIQEFVGPFHTGHALGFAEEIDAEVDTLLTGLYSDDLFGSWSVPQATLRLPFGVQFWLPFERLPSTTADFVANQVAAGPTRKPAFLESKPLEDVLAENVRSRNGRVDYHGVDYESVEQLSLSSTLYPITNGIGFDLYSALQIAPTRNPFLDRRLVDLALSMPLKYRLRHDPLHRAMAKFDSSLAELPHASSRLPIEYPKAAHVLGARVTNQLDKLGRSNSYRTDGPWQDRDEVVRTDDFVGRSLEANEAVGRRLPGIDMDAARETYRRHRAGEIDAAEELYRLVTVLEMPLTERVVGE
ncbi:asparagine synthase-related protein [Halostagnicola kamekurae]|uniref:Asparagine synthase (Glutamine-hydrolysing) n=1 Tax=Halostagnicola kamekurae TaxID=619731 RepID=A0A1I6PMH9_9EURY|nr:asparagine synthase-related protein [Halostagnicola kamekurae]SFS41423.1 asparagine synthase (glutamine-hydrolysing) [Halostagnicola kamekurae]